MLWKEERTMTRKELEEYIETAYNTEPEHPWAPETDHTVFRRADSRKWFALVMEIPRSKLGIEGAGKICIVNLKCDRMMLGSFLLEDGIFPAWHMNKSHWLSADVSGNDERLKLLIDLSFELTAGKAGKTKEKNQK